MRNIYDMHLAECMYLHIRVVCVCAKKGKLLYKTGGKQMAMRMTTIITPCLTFYFTIRRTRKLENERRRLSGNIMIFQIFIFVILSSPRTPQAEPEGDCRA